MASSSSKSTDFGVMVAAIGGIVTSTIVLLAAGTILKGWVLSFLWRWFVADTFGIQALTIGQAIGVSMVVSFLVYSPNTDKVRGSETDYAAFIGHMLIAPLITLGIAFIVKQFI